MFASNISGHVLFANLIKMPVLNVYHPDGGKLAFAVVFLVSFFWREVFCLCLRMDKLTCNLEMFDGCGHKDRAF